MAAVTPIGLPAFTRLPMELLDSILNHSLPDKSTYSYWRQIVDTSILKSLRLACRQFAYLPALNEVLFYSIRLVASPEHVHLADVTDLSGIKPYVQEIVMEPTKYSWTMTEEIFEDIVLITPLQKFCDRANEEIRRKPDENTSWRDYLGRELFYELGMRGFAEKYMDGKLPFSDTEIRTGYERYMQHVRGTQHVFETNQVQHAWIKALMQLPDVHTFKIGKWDFNLDWHEHYHGKAHKAADCQQLQTPVGEALFSAAIASLVAARPKIIQLDIECVVDERFAWADKGEIEDLDLSHLQTLSFQPVGVEDHDPGSKPTVITRYGLAITKLLHKYSTNLQKLDLCSSTSSSPLPWPPSRMTGSPDLPPLPALVSFRTSLTLRLHAFAHFLHQSPALNHLQLDGCSGDLSDWRELWDAVRNHPNRMTLEFDQLPCHEATEVSVYHNTGEPSKAEFDDDPWDNIMYSLENYMSGLRHWDRSLMMWFENGDGEPTDEEEDEDDWDGDSDSSNPNE